MSAGEEADAFNSGEGLKVEWLSSGSALVRIPPTGSGACKNEEGGYRLVREGTDAGMLGSYGTMLMELVGAERERWSGTLQTGYEEGSSRICSQLRMAAENSVEAELVSWCRVRKTLRIGLKI